MFLTVLVISLLVVVALLLWRERRTVRAAGMSETTPVCCRCHYRLGGWTTSICPECGADVRSVGVRTGDRATRIVLGVIVLVVALVVVGPVAMTVFSWPFATRDVHGHRRFESMTVGRLSVTLETRYTWLRSPRCDYDTSVTLIAFAGRPRGGAWHNGRYVGPAERRELTVAFANGTGPPDDGRIAGAVRDVLPPGTDEDTVLAHVRAVETLVQEVLDRQSRGTLGTRMLVAGLQPPLRDSGSGGGGGRSGAAWPAGVLTLVAMVLFAGVGRWAVNRSCRSGWRLPREREWENAVGSV